MYVYIYLYEVRTRYKHFIDLSIYLIFAIISIFLLFLLPLKSCFEYMEF